MLVPKNSDSVYQVNVTIIRTHIIITIVQTTGLKLNFLCLDVFVVVPSVKNFQDQQNSRIFLVFPGRITNSRRFPVFPGIVDTLFLQPPLDS